MRIDLQPGERLIREGAANLMRGREAVGGRLFLTDRRLHFASHAFNIARGPTDLPLADVAATEPCWTKFLGVLPLLPNSLAVRTRDGTEYRFVVYGRRKWQAAIETERQAMPA